MGTGCRASKLRGKWQPQEARGKRLPLRHSPLEWASDWQGPCQEAQPF